CRQNNLRQRTRLSRVRHCLRRSRESDAQHPLAQLLVAATRIPNAEHVTPASATDAFLKGFAMEPSCLCVSPPRAALYGQMASHIRTFIVIGLLRSSFDPQELARQQQLF